MVIALKRNKLIAPIPKVGQAEPLVMTELPAKSRWLEMGSSTGFVFYHPVGWQ